MPPPTLGKKLKHAREQQGFTLADVAHKTRIPVPRLRDMEADNYNSFGSLTYARCFLQTYANFVGVDPNPVTDRMDPTPLGGARDYRYLTESFGRWIGVNTDDSLMPDARPVRSYRAATFIAAVLCIALVGGVLWARAFFGDREPPAAESKPEPRREISRESSSGDKEIRAAIPVSAATTENIPVRRALPVEDDPKPRRKK